MVKKIVLGIVLIMISAGNICIAETLAEKLPDSTALYLEIDIANFLNNLESYAKFVDEDLGANLVADVKELRESYKELAAANEFAPELFDNLHTSNGYLVLLRRAEPIITTRTIKIPSFNQQNNFPDNNDGDNDFQETPRWNYEDKEITETTNYAFSLIIETTPEIAQNFLEELIVCIDFHAEGKQDEGNAYKEIEVDAGRMISSSKDRIFFGYLDNYIVISFGKPDDLWVFLQEPAESNLFGINLNQRYSQDKLIPMPRILTNVGAFVKYGEEDMLKNLEKVRAAAEEDKAENPGAAYSMKAYELQAAEQFIKIFNLFKTVFSIDRLRFAGTNSTFEKNEDSIQTDSRISLEVEPPLANGLLSLLDGGAELQPPHLDSSESCVIMSRLGLAEIYQDVIINLEPEVQQSFQAMMMLMKMQVGYELSDLLPQLAGDSYLYIDIEEKEYEQRKWDSVTQDFESVTVVGPLPKFMLLQGLNDPEAFAETFSGLFTRLVAIPAAGKYVRKTVYQETDVYIVGPDAGKPDADPDGLYNFAMVVVGRYLSTGSWEDVTELIRREKAAEKPDAVLSQLVETHPDSNLLVYLPKGFQQELYKINQKNQDEQEEIILQAIDNIDLNSDDKELVERNREAIRKLYKDIMLFNEKISANIEDVVMYGELKDNFYEIRSNTVFNKD